METNLVINTERMQLEKGDKIQIYSRGCRYFTILKRNGKIEICNSHTSERISVFQFDNVHIVNARTAIGIIEDEGRKFFYRDGKFRMLGDIEDQYIAGTYVRTKDTKKGLFGVHDFETRTQVVKNEYDEICIDFGGFFVARKGEKWGIIRQDGRTVVPIEYPRESIIYNEGFWIVEMQSGRCVLYTGEGRKVT